MILFRAINDPSQLAPPSVLPPAFVARSNMKSFMSRKILNVVIPDALLKASICRLCSDSVTSNICRTSHKDMVAWHQRSESEDRRRFELTLLNMQLHC